MMVFIEDNEDDVFLHKEWTDNSLKWDPVEYGGVNMLYVPAESIWIPDLVLYNKWVSNL